MVKRISDIYSRKNGKTDEKPIWELDGGPPPKVIARGAPVMPKYLRRVSAVLAVAFAAMALFYLVGFWNLKQTVAEATPKIYEELKEAGVAFKDLDLREAKRSLESVQGSITSIHGEATRYQLLALANLWGNLIPKLKSVPQAFEGIMGIAEAAVGFTGDLENLKENGMSWLMGREGEKFTAAVSSLHGRTAAIIDLNKSLSANASSLNYPMPDELLGANVELYRTERFLNAFVKWLGRKDEKRILVLFQNQSEIRPGGGFIGSYGDVTMDGAGVKAIEVNDIYPADRELEKITQVIPPAELRGITSFWGARDANWFFHFPTSAEKVAKFLEASPNYRSGDVHFDAVIGMNVSVIESIIAAAGEIPLPEYDLVINRENFLPEIQREVEAGSDKFLLRQPKKILGVLAPKIFAAVGSFDDEKKKFLAKALAHHLESKDLMFYSRDPEFQNFFESADVSGSVFELPANRPGEYLAVVNANVAGGKADAFVQQSIKLSSKIEPDGSIDNYLTIERTHSGSGEQDWWYRATDWNYLKIFLPRESRLIYASGNDEREIKDLLDYRTGKYIVDPELAAVERTKQETLIPGISKTEESGKTVFGTWFSLKAGATKKMVAQYLNPTKLNLAADRIPYSFVFDKQSGAETSLDVLIEAPPGFHWEENGQSAFNYFEDDLPRRVKVDLTLVRE